MYYKYVDCFRFILRGKVGANVLHSCNGCSFELEICYLPSIGSLNSNLQLISTPEKSVLKNSQFRTPDNSPKFSLATKMVTNNEDMQLIDKDEHFAFVGIRRKRLKGDSWCYKKVCEEVLAFNTNHLNVNLESAV